MSEEREAYSKALDALGNGDLREAARRMELMIQDYPQFFDAYEGLSMVYSRLGELDKAIALMQNLSQKDPKNPMAHTNLSIFYMKKGMKEKAEEEKAKATVLQFSRMADPKKPE